jgi:2-C-methyl-D-erythritol 4-phosphate cytidylyltransferase/2-C-methyl-D-erythritol 2,4-cyclodiphosphate synthase
MNNYFVILAAGKGRRFDKNKPKQFFQYKNKEIIDHSIEKSLESKIFKKIVVVTNNLNRLKKKK